MRKLRRFVGVGLGILSLAFVSVSLTPLAAAKVKKLKVMVPMRDGVKLSTNVFLPNGSRGRWPVLLTRTPYDKGEKNPFPLASRAGYVVVAQDCRGRYDSEGEFYPYRYETDDGYDTCEWIVSQPWCNGKIGTFGGSYVGATQMLLAVSGHPNLVAMAPGVTGSDYYEGWTYQGGALRLYLAATWAVGLARVGLMREKDKTKFDKKVVEAIENGRRYMKGWLWQLPLDKFYPMYQSGLAPYFFDWLHHPADGPYWAQWRIKDRYSSIKVPALHIAAWYDLFLKSSLENFTGLSRSAATAAARKGQRLIIALGGHAGGYESTKYGAVDFGPDAAIDLQRIELDFFNKWIKGKNPGSDPVVRYFLMGANEWRSAYTWPPARARKVRYYLRSTGQAGTIMLDGKLSRTPGGDEPPDSFDYDPSNPVPTVGGTLCCAPIIPNGPQDQRFIEIRPDVLVYSTPPLRRSVEVVGPVAVELYASSSAVDTDFTAKLVDVYPDGFCQNLVDGIVRARYRESRTRASFLTPGKIYKFHIEMNATANLFKRGHRIRVEISSSNFPCYDRNLNTGKELYSDTAWRVAHQTVYHDREHPSSLILSVMTASRGKRP